MFDIRRNPFWTITHIVINIVLTLTVARIRCIFVWQEVDVAQAVVAVLLLLSMMLTLLLMLLLLSKMEFIMNNEDNDFVVQPRSGRFNVLDLLVGIIHSQVYIL